MKRIIDGTTYDTDTATEVYSDASSNPFSLGYWGLFQTRHGAFFKVVCDHDGETHTFTPLSDSEAQKLLERHANHLVEKYFGPFRSTARPRGGSPSEYRSAWQGELRQRRRLKI